MEIQARIPAALCVLHNFIHEHDPAAIVDEGYDFEDLRVVHEDGPAVGELSQRVANDQDWQQAATRRDEIAEEMWQDYQHRLQAEFEEV